MTSFDAIIIGTGQAGPALAGKLTGTGLSVAIIERKLFGGTCVNTGCTPTKTLVASAYAAQLVRRAADYGSMIEGVVQVDMRRVKARADTVAGNSRKGVENYLRQMKGCTVLQGHARFEGPDTVSVGGEWLTAPRIFINVGGRAIVPNLPGTSAVAYLTNTTMLALDHLPEHLIVVGGSYVGLEFAQMYRRFGAQVTVIERQPRLVAKEDQDISEAIREILLREGITVRTSAECISLAPHEKGVSVGVDCADGEPTSVGSHVLLAVGRRPNTDDLGLEKAGVATDVQGHITVDDGLATNVPGIWALGDCNGRGAFTHTAYNDFEIVAANLLAGEHRGWRDRIPAYALYIDPPLGRCGLTESEIRQTTRHALIGKRSMTKVARAVEKGETEGFMKIVVDAQTNEVLGAAILGVGGDEAIHSILDVMYAKAPYTVIERAVHIHPTVSELIPTMLGELQPLSEKTGTASRPS
jgi:pyruvate/2-oxoglutarate dehydrogenase complex dihydrolipoamide dehydrogenase (E3) component